jgi:hypothetical protein
MFKLDKIIDEIFYALSCFKYSSHHGVNGPLEVKEAPTNKRSDNHSDTTWEIHAPVEMKMSS